MNWNRRYWEIVERYYWSPSDLGLKSIPKDQWRRQDGEIAIPGTSVTGGGSLYTRRDGAKPDVMSKLRRAEETLNDVFNIALSIAPDAVIAKLLLQPVGIADRGPFELHAREIGERYGWGQDNVTQPDALLMSPTALVGVELKLGAKSSVTQILKYLAVMVLEEAHSGSRGSLSLLFVTPSQDDTGFWRSVGLDGPRVDGAVIDRALGMKLNGMIRRLVEERRAEFESVAERLRMAHVGWNDLLIRIDTITAGLDHFDMGEQTLFRLLSGLRDQISSHCGTFVGTVSPTAS